MSDERRGPKFRGISLALRRLFRAFSRKQSSAEETSVARQGMSAEEPVTLETAGGFAADLDAPSAESGAAQASKIDPGLPEDNPPTLVITDASPLADADAYEVMAYTGSGDCSASDRMGDGEALRARLARGAVTQFANARTGPVVDIVIGLDFGTSTTKVVVRAPYFAGVSPHALPILPALQAEENPYLWKTALWVNPNGEFLPTGEDEGAVSIKNIKQNLTGGEPQRAVAITRDGRGVCAWEAAIAYLAIVFRYTRGWFLETKATIYRRSPLLWQTNIGLPAATYDDPELVSLYRRTSAAAWLLSQEPVPITLSAVQHMFNDPRVIAASQDAPNAREELGLEVVPEVAAEVVGFARSTQRREGLYAMVDVGGGTLDVCTFRLHSASVGIDRYSMFTADVQPQGAEILRRYLEEGGSAEEFAREVTGTVKRTIWETKIRRDPTAPEWRTELPVFLCGGGSAGVCHRKAVQSVGSWLAKHTRARGAPVLTLDCPEGFDAQMPKKSFHRLAVAWGLSYPRFDIGELHRPRDIPDFVPKRVRDDAEVFVSKDQV